MKEFVIYLSIGFVVLVVYELSEYIGKRKLQGTRVYTPSITGIDAGLCVLAWPLLLVMFILELVGNVFLFIIKCLLKIVDQI
jgi:hypothetical protein